LLFLFLPSCYYLDLHSFLHDALPICIIDLMATLPTYLAILFSGPQLLFVIRIFRFLRVFRVLRLRSFMIEANELTYALKKSSAKIGRDTSELQSRENLVCRLLLEKKK